jgi:hypothetical protein
VSFAMRCFCNERQELCITVVRLRTLHHTPGLDLLGGRVTPMCNWSSIIGLYRAPGLGFFFGAILVRCSGTRRAVLCAKRKEIKTAVDSRSIAPESLHGTMFREHFSGELKL